MKRLIAIVVLLATGADVHGQRAPSAGFQGGSRSVRQAPREGAAGEARALRDRAVSPERGPPPGALRHGAPPAPRAEPDRPLSAAEVRQLDRGLEQQYRRWGDRLPDAVAERLPPGWRRRPWDQLPDDVREDLRRWYYAWIEVYTWWYAEDAGGHAPDLSYREDGAPVRAGDPVPVGLIVTDLPDAQKLIHGGKTWYESGGLYFRSQIVGGRVEYTCVEAPLGLRLERLPEGAQALAVGSATRWHAAGTWYTPVRFRGRDQFEVCAAPVSWAVAGPADG